MKKMLLVLSLVSIATAYSATNQVLKAELVVVDPAAEVAVNVTTTSLRFGDVGIIKGGTAKTNDVTIKLTGNNAQGASLTIPDRGVLTLKGGTDTVPVKYVLGTIVDGGSATSGGNHIITSTGNLGDGTAGKPMSVDMSASMALLGTEKSGLYEGTVQIDAKYN